MGSPLTTDLFFLLSNFLEENLPNSLLLGLGKGALLCQWRTISPVEDYLPSLASHKEIIKIWFISAHGGMVMVSATSNLIKLAIYPISIWLLPFLFPLPSCCTAWVQHGSKKAEPVPGTLSPEMVCFGGMVLGALKNKN